MASNTQGATKILFDNLRSQYIQGNKEEIWKAVTTIFEAEGEIKQEWRSILELLLNEKE